MLYTFGDCELDTDLYILRRADQAAHLSPKVFQVLMYLLEHRDRVIDKDELCEQVWPEQFIADATLESTLRAVRQVVGDSGTPNGDSDPPWVWLSVCGVHHRTYGPKC